MLFLHASSVYNFTWFLLTVFHSIHFTWHSVLFLPMFDFLIDAQCASEGKLFEAEIFRTERECEIHLITFEMEYFGLDSLDSSPNVAYSFWNFQTIRLLFFVLFSIRKKRMFSFCWTFEVWIFIWVHFPFWRLKMVEFRLDIVESKSASKSERQRKKSTEP